MLILMKKTYMKPATTAVAVHFNAALLAMSDTDINPEGEASVILSDKQGWNCEDWSGETEE